MESVEAANPQVLDAETPCSEFTVAELMDHIVLVVRRAAIIGHGEHWSTVQQELLGSDWAKHFRAALNHATQSWSDPAKLGHLYEVPWGEIPGAPLLMTYSGELAVHGWDLSTATGIDFAVADDLLAGPMVAATFVPADVRDDPQVPFGPVVDPGPDASELEKLAGWMGRQVAAR